MILYVRMAPVTVCYGAWGCGALGMVCLEVVAVNERDTDQFPAAPSELSAAF